LSTTLGRSSAARPGQRVEGRTIYGTATGPWFKCRLTLPSALETDAEVVRPVQIVPTVLYGIRDENGDVVILHNDVRLGGGLEGTRGLGVGRGR